MNGQRVLQKWNAETHEAILIEVIDHLEVSTSDWKVIVEKLQDKGHTFTHSALMYVSAKAQSDQIAEPAVAAFLGTALSSFPLSSNHTFALGSP